MSGLEAPLAVAGFAAAPKIIRDLRDSFTAIKVAIHDFKNAENIYNDLLSNILLTKRHVYRKFGVLLKIHSDFTPEDTTIIRESMLGIYRQLETLKEFAEKSRIQPNEKSLSKFKKKLCAGFTTKITDANKAVDDMFARMIKIDYRADEIDRYVQMHLGCLLHRYPF